jgi:hypothetical protein
MLVVSFRDALQPDFALTARLPVKQTDSSPRPLPVRDYGDADIAGKLVRVGVGCAELYDPQHKQSLLVLPDCGCVLKHRQKTDGMQIETHAVIIAVATAYPSPADCSLGLPTDQAQAPGPLLIRITDGDDAAQLLMRMKLQDEEAVNSDIQPLSGTIFSRNERWESMIAANLLDRLESPSSSEAVLNQEVLCGQKEGEACERPKTVLILSVWSVRMAAIALKYIQRDLDNGTLNRCVLHNANAGGHGAGEWAPSAANVLNVGNY